MPYLSVVNGIPTMIDDGNSAPIAPRAPSPVQYARPDDRIVLRPGRPPMVIKAAEELELEVREIEEPDDPAWGSIYIPDTPAEPIDIPVSKPSRDPALDLWRQGVMNEDADAVIQFYKERLEKSDDAEQKTGTAALAVAFNDWRDKKGLEDRPKEGSSSFNQLLFEFLAPRYKNKDKKIFFGVRIVLTDEEKNRKEAMERVRRDKEAAKAAIEEQKRIKEHNLTNPPETPPSSEEDEPTKKKEELKEIINWTHKKIHRHPVFTNYGADLITGEIVKLKKNKVERIVSISFKSGSANGGITLEGPKDEDGKRYQQYFSVMKFIAECGKLKGETKFHTKLMFNRECEAYIKRPIALSLPLACISYEYDGGIDFTGDINRGIKSGNALVQKCKKSKQIDDYIEGLKNQHEENRKADKLEIAKLKAKVAKLEAENVRLQQDCITPLKAGAIQLQELLMTEHQGSTFWEMLQFCVKDITRDYPKNDDDEYERSDYGADFGLFEMSPRGLPRPDENHIRQID